MIYSKQKQSSTAKRFGSLRYFYRLAMNTINRPIRVLVAKVGLDGHDRGAKVIATALRDAGMEVIYTGLRQTPEMVVSAALQEDVDAIGISILSGAHMTVFPKVAALMKEKGMNDVLLTGGGIIPEEDMTKLNEQGVGRLFAPGTPTSEIAGYIQNWVKEHRPF
jgi:methylmalonyl-CoA mutase C-terminal domain/subunit